MSKANMEFLQIIKLFFFLVKYVTYVKLCKLRGPSCYDIRVISILLPKDNLLKSFKFEQIWTQIFSFSCIWRKDGKVFGKTTLTFWHIAHMVNLFVLLHMTILHQKMQKTKLCVLRLWWHRIIYLCSNMVLVIARNHKG